MELTLLASFISYREGNSLHNSVQWSPVKFTLKNRIRIGSSKNSNETSKFDEGKRAVIEQYIGLLKLWLHKHRLYFCLDK